MSCPDGYLFYTCAKGPFTGCCASDPCNSGTCPEKDQPDESTATAPSTTKTSATKPTNTATDDPNTPTQISTLTSSTVSAHPDRTETATAPTQSSTDPAGSPPSDSGDGNKGPLIGGIVGGLLAALLLIALIIFLFIRRRRRQSGLHTSLARWKAAQRSGSPPPAPMAYMYAGIDQKQDDESPSISNHDQSPMPDHGGFYNPVINRPHSTALSESSLPSGEPTLVGSPRVSHNPMNSGSSVSVSASASPSQLHHHQTDSRQPGLIPLHTLREGDGSQRNSLAYGNSARDSVFISELSDTSTDRRRSELPSDPHGDSLPAPPTQTHQRYHDYSPAHSRTSSQNVAPPLTITTPDGAILQSNLNRRPADPGSPRSPHVMSFMEYSQESDKTEPDENQRDTALNSQDPVTQETTQANQVP